MIYKKSDDWNYFSEIFNQRNPDIFEFQSKSILKKGNKGTRWDREEVDLLDSLIKYLSSLNLGLKSTKTSGMRSLKNYSFVQERNFLERPNSAENIG